MKHKIVNNFANNCFSYAVFACLSAKIVPLYNVIERNLCYK